MTWTCREENTFFMLIFATRIAVQICNSFQDSSMSAAQQRRATALTDDTLRRWEGSDVEGAFAVRARA